MKCLKWKYLKLVVLAAIRDAYYRVITQKNIRNFEPVPPYHPSRQTPTPSWGRGPISRSEASKQHPHLWRFLAQIPPWQVKATSPGLRPPKGLWFAATHVAKQIKPMKHIFQKMKLDLGIGRSPIFIACWVLPSHSVLPASCPASCAANLASKVLESQILNSSSIVIFASDMAKNQRAQDQPISA